MFRIIPLTNQNSCPWGRFRESRAARRCSEIRWSLVRVICVTPPSYAYGLGLIMIDHDLIKTRQLDRGTRMYGLMLRRVDFAL
jgi:hypothetical protein